MINIPMNEAHELGDSRRTLWMNSGLYTRVTSEKTQVYLILKKLVTTDGFNKCLQGQIIDQIL